METTLGNMTRSWHMSTSATFMMTIVRGGISQINTDKELSPITKTENDFAIKGMPIMRANRMPSQPKC